MIRRWSVDDPWLICRCYVDDLSARGAHLCISVEAAISSKEADFFFSKLPPEVLELLVRQRLQGSGVENPAWQKIGERGERRKRREEASQTYCRLLEANLPFADTSIINTNTNYGNNSNGNHNSAMTGHYSKNYIYLFLVTRYLVIFTKVPRKKANISATNTNNKTNTAPSPPQPPKYHYHDTNSPFPLLPFLNSS